VNAGKVGFTEVGPRDGFQNWPDPVPTAVKLDLVRSALAAGVARVEATSMVSPKWVPQLADARDLLAALAPEMDRLRVLVPNRRGYEDAVALGVRNVLVNVGVTDGFNRKNLNREVSETLADIDAITADAAGRGVRVDASLSVSWGCPFDGPVTPGQVVAVAGRLVDAGVAELSFGDTIGVATPDGVRAVSELALSRFPGVEVSMHFHDTRGMALANTLAALETGVRNFEGSVGGIGGCPFAPNSTGNVCSEDLLFMVEAMGFDTGVDLDLLADAARALATSLSAELPGRFHRAGRQPWLQGTRAGAAAGR
jgi:hydroxymethylglutaryl-CoA lyase